MADSVAVTDTTFESEVLNSTTPVLVDFWAEWCQPCRMLAPHLDKVAAEQGEKLKVVKLNVDENPRMMQQFQIRGIPTLILFKEGQPVETIVGFKPAKDISEIVGRHTS
jgi:thioredoxin 1